MNAKHCRLSSCAFILCLHAAHTQSTHFGIINFNGERCRWLFHWVYIEDASILIRFVHLLNFKDFAQQNQQTQEHLDGLPSTCELSFAFKKAFEMEFNWNFSCEIPIHWRILSFLLFVHSFDTFCQLEYVWMGKCHANVNQMISIGMNSQQLSNTFIIIIQFAAVTKRKFPNSCVKYFDFSKRRNKRRNSNFVRPSDRELYESIHWNYLWIRELVHQQVSWRWTIERIRSSTRIAYFGQMFGRHKVVYKRWMATTNQFSIAI